MSRLEKKIIDQLNKYGYSIVSDVFSEKKCTNTIYTINQLLKKINQKKNNERMLVDYGQVVLRDLILRSPKIFLKYLNIPLVKKILNKVFQDEYILDNYMASNSISVKKKYKALVHIDSHLPAKELENTSDIVVLLCLDNFTKNNGCTKIWPKSHKLGVRIQNKKKYLKNNNKFKFVEAKRGSMIFFLGQTWHQIGQNINNESRWGILMHFKRWWIKPSTDFTKCGKKIYQLLNDHERQLFGFNSISPKYDFKNKTRMLKTLRNVKNVSKNYFKAISY